MSRDNGNKPHLNNKQKPLNNNEQKKHHQKQLEKTQPFYKQTNINKKNNIRRIFFTSP